MKKYKFKLTPDGEKLFQVSSEKIKLRRATLYLSLFYTTIAFSLVWFIAFDALALIAEEMPFWGRLLAGLLAVFPVSVSAGLQYYLENEA